MVKDKILVVDDEASMIQSICRSIRLEDEDYEMHSACNGKEALDVFYREQPVLVILDLNMPVMGGIEFLEALSLASFDPCSVIVLTGQRDDTYIKKCFDLGASAFLRKPFNDYEIIGLVRHLISLKRVQQLLKEQIARQKSMQKTIDHQRDRFLAVLMHDLKNPLIPTVNLARKLAAGKVKSEDDKQRKLGIIRESAENLLDIIENTSRTLKKSPVVLRKPDITVVQLKEIIRTVINTYLSVIEDKGIKVSINGENREQWGDDDNFTLEADYNQIKTVVENLLDNAIKYANNRIDVSIAKRGASIVMAVSDDGPGIDEYYHDRIFEDYFQTPGSKSGYGLGMSSIKSIVDNHEGEVTVKSSPGSGTTFEITLPCQSRRDVLPRRIP